MDLEKVAGLIRELLTELGEDPRREGLVETPQRVARALEYLISGYRADVRSIINGATFEQKTSSMIIVKNIEIYSLCEHHMMPFFGLCHVGYLPSGRVFGISKIARLADAFARRLQIQERLTEEIAEAVNEAINPLGVGVLIEARHLCMMMRGVGKQGSSLVTSALLGLFRESAKTRDEFLTLAGKQPPP
jgi:GTP cyclohydrolase I